MGSAVLGWPCAIIAAFTFSVQFVPVKKYEVFDGITFQWFLCYGALFAAFVITWATGDLFLGFDKLPLIAGFMWGLANYLCVPLIQLVGMGLGFSMFHFVNIMCGYCIGRFGLFGIPQAGSLVSDIGCGIVLFSFFLLTFVEGGHAEQGQASPPNLTDTYESCGSQVGGNVYLRRSFGVLRQTHGARHPNTDAEPEPVSPEMPQHSVTDPGAMTRNLLHSPRVKTLRNVGLKLLSVLLAIVTGVLTGSCVAPATLYNLKHPGRPTAAVFPMSLGAWIMGTCIYVFYASYAKLQRLPVRHAAIRPSFTAGALWCTGNAANLLGVTQIPYTLCYSTSNIGCLLLAGIYSLVIFREITQARQIAIFSVGLASQAVGVVLIAYGSSG